MALADYFERDLVAASQVVAGFDRAAFEARVGRVRVALAWGPDAADGSVGQALLDLSVRLLARFYPAIRLEGRPGPLREQLEELALAINPRINLAGRGVVDGGIAVGAARPSFDRIIYAGADDWTAEVGTLSQRAIGGYEYPFGAGAAASIAAANLFRMLLLPDPRLDRETRLAVPPLVGADAGLTLRSSSSSQAALIGAGAIGNATAWALARTPSAGQLTIVDHETIELSNLQRYVLAERRDEEARKTDVAVRVFVGSTVATPFPDDLRAFVEARGHAADSMLLALDSAADRRAAQASLPRWIANAWTQPNDVGVSVHPSFGSGGACVACLYLPSGVVPNEDALVADALMIPELLADVRTLLHSRAGVSLPMLNLIAERMQIPVDLFARYEGKPIRELYVEGVCGGGVIPLGRTGTPRSEVHVPLAHQSAMAGVLLAAALVAGLDSDRSPSVLSHLDPSRPIPSEPTQRVRARGDRTCICEDRDYRLAWQNKYVGRRRERPQPERREGSLKPMPAQEDSPET
jgi:hypothetical protein